MRSRAPVDYGRLSNTRDRPQAALKSRIKVGAVRMDIYVLTELLTYNYLEVLRFEMVGRTLLALRPQPNQRWIQKFPPENYFGPVRTARRCPGDLCRCRC